MSETIWKNQTHTGEIVKQEMTGKDEVLQRALLAKKASQAMAHLSTADKNKALLAMADGLLKEKEEILFRNGIDVEAAKDANLAPALIERLILNEKRVQDMAQGLREMAELKDPIGELLEEWDRPNGIKVRKMRVPLGVIGMIYESRPNVTVDAAGLALKSGNAVILRGGSEAIESNRALIRAIAKAAYASGIPEGTLQLIEQTDREAVRQLIRLDTLVDLVIPRGGETMIQEIREQATVPVLSHGKGLCHVFIDADADLGMAEKIALNAKVHRPGVCNAMETLLVHKDIAPRILPTLLQKYKEAGVEVRGDEAVQKAASFVKPATEKDWDTEYLDLILSVRVVDSLDEAINHINRHGSRHSESIVTSDKAHAERFQNEVDAAAVFHNASTRLHDGSVFGFGAEIGISTSKLHARGTMGLKELTTTKFLIDGTGQIRE